MENLGLLTLDILRRIESNTLLAAKQVLTLDDMVIFTGLSKTHLYKLTMRHEIPFYRPNGKNMYFDRNEIEEWLKQNREATVDEVEEKATSYIVTTKRGGRNA